jgi:exodeoxyribonuclease III
VRLATWNVNSLKVRLPRVEAWLAEIQPDILCMQETKLADDAFPALTFNALGYETAHNGQGQWNGVAILSKVGLANVVTSFGDGEEPDVESRFIQADCGGINISSIYVPNGRALDDEHYQYKLRWLNRLLRHLELTADSGGNVVVMGDFNIAPEDRDVYDPAKFEGATHTSPPERAMLAALAAWGLEDLFRRFHDEGQIYSWWDYRAGDFHQGRGLRIDLVMASRAVADRAVWTVIDRNARKGQSPSDHAPVIIDLED